MKKTFIVLFLLSVQFSFSQVLNEICASNHTGFESDLVGFADWIELYNEDVEDLELEGWHLTDDITNPSKWTFPEMEIEEGEYLTLFAKEETAFDSVISFAFRKAGDTLFLLDPSFNIIDVLIHPPLHSDDSYGRIGDRLFYFDSPSPNALNDTVLAYKGYAETPTINRVAGVASAGTHIVIRPASIGDEIYYSTRGIIGDQLYNSDIILTQSTTIHASAIGDSMLLSPPITRTYFINEHAGLPVVNITADSLALFDEVIGITRFGPDASPTFPYIGANFWKDIDLPAYYEFFDSDFSLVENLACELEIYGGPGSRINPLKSFELKTSKSNDDLIFRQRYFEEKDVARFNRLILRNSGNDYCGTCIKDGTLHKYFTQQELNVDFLGFQPVVFYMNGHYQGILNLREKADKYYVSNNYGYSPDNVNVLENWNLVVKAGTDVDFRELWYFARDNDLALEENYNWVAERLDIPSMMDYFMIEFFLNNRDWPNSNIRVWNVPGEAKWRYMCYDLDVAYRYGGTTQEDLQFLKFALNEWSVMSPHIAILSALLENSNYRHDFINRYCDLLNTALEPETMSAGILAGKEPLQADMPRHYEKWCDDISVWHERFNGNVGFIHQRPDLIRIELAEIFELPEAVGIRINTYPLNADEIVLNTLVLEEFPFEGQYFTTNTITLTATEKGGSIFHHWENVRTGELYFDKHIIIDPVEGDHFVAFYETDAIFGLKIYPNPIEEIGTLTYSLPEATRVEIEIYSVLGRQVFQYSDEGVKDQGGYSFDVILNDFVAGVYYLRFITVYGEETIRFVKV